MGTTTRTGSCGRTSRRLRVPATLLLWVLVAGGALAGESGEDRSLSIVKRLIDAFNGHDAQAMAAQVSDEFELFYVAENGESELSVRGRDALAREMTAYFEAHPSVRSVVDGAIEGNVYISVRERIVGGDSSIAVYEVRDGKVRRAWYFPAERTSSGK